MHEEEEPGDWEEPALLGDQVEGLLQAALQGGEGGAEELGVVGERLGQAEGHPGAGGVDGKVTEDGIEVDRRDGHLYTHMLGRNDSSVGKHVLSLKVNPIAIFRINSMQPFKEAGFSKNQNSPSFCNLPG